MSICIECRKVTETDNRLRCKEHEDEWFNGWMEIADELKSADLDELNAKDVKHG